ncbi:MAG: endonuclease/exonuclease/phosphatase family protein [Bacteroidales bacterium]|nr:endonuclease/exonuclease/phosphatase family protein [Bacteroidales bacterium]
MKRILLLMAALLPLMMGCSPKTLNVMSYNIRFGKAKDGDFVWENRKGAAVAMVNDQHPAVFGVQEALDFQLEDLLKGCPDYKCVGVGREDGLHKGEHMAVFYNTGKVELENWGTYWLSETPEAPSKGWDAMCKRTATWALLKDKASGKHFYFVNTHLDHVGKEAQKNGLALVVERIGKMNPEGYPMILMGDFNVYADDPCLKDLRGIMLDAWETAKTVDDGPTYHGYGKDEKPHIDYIFYTGFPSCEKMLRVTREYPGCRFVSDHYPITAEFRW